MTLSRARVKKAIDAISVAALRSWLNAKGLPHSANTREQMVERLYTLLRLGRLSEEEFEDGLISIEEACGKRVFLYRASPKDLAKLTDSGAFARHLRKIGVVLRSKPIMAPRLPSKPTLAYVLHEPRQIRAKWGETQTKVGVDIIQQQFRTTKITKVIVLVVDLESGIVQLRLEKAEQLHMHRDEKDKPTEGEYVAYYRNGATELLGLEFSSVELREALRSLVETHPRVVRVELKDFRTAANSRVRFAATGDVRDDQDWKAMYDEGGALWAYDSEAVYWLPSTSKGKLTREVFTDIDARTGKLRVEADCHEAEIQYAISQIGEHQKKASPAL